MFKYSWAACMSVQECVWNTTYIQKLHVHIAHFVTNLRHSLGYITPRYAEFKRVTGCNIQMTTVLWISVLNSIVFGFPLWKPQIIVPQRTYMLRYSHNSWNIWWNCTFIQEDNMVYSLRWVWQLGGLGGGWRMSTLTRQTNRQRSMQLDSWHWVWKDIATRSLSTYMAWSFTRPRWNACWW